MSEHYQPHPAFADGTCACLEACCNEMRYADDGDGHVDAMPERNTCPLGKPGPFADLIAAGYGDMTVAELRRALRLAEDEEPDE